MDFEEDMALEAYQNALRDLEAFRPTYDRMLTSAPLNESEAALESAGGEAEIRQRWVDLEAEVERTRAQLQRVRGR